MSEDPDKKTNEEPCERVGSMKIGGSILISVGGCGPDDEPARKYLVMSANASDAIVIPLVQSKSTREDSDDDLPGMPFRLADALWDLPEELKGEIRRFDKNLKRLWRPRWELLDDLDRKGSGES